MVEDSLDFSGRGRKIKDDSIINSGVENTLDFSGRGRKITQLEREQRTQVQLPPKATIKSGRSTKIKRGRSTEIQSGVGVQGLFGSGPKQTVDIKIKKQDFEDIGKSLRGFIRGSEGFGKRLRGKKQVAQLKRSTRDRSATRKFKPTPKTIVREALPSAERTITTPSPAQNVLSGLKMKFGLK